MNPEEIKKIFLELLEKDEEFKIKLQQFIISAVTEKFFQTAEKVTEPPKEIEIEAAENIDAEKISALEKQLKDWQEKYSALEQEKNSADVTVKNLSSQLEKLRREKSAVENERDNLRREKSAAENERDNLRREKSAVENEFEKLRREKSAVENERDNLRRDKAAAENELEKLRREKSAAENERDNLRRDKAAAENELEKLRREKSAAENEFEKLRREKSAAERECTDLQNQLEARFQDGWELYQAFLEIEKSLREEAGLYDSIFESFICSGAQMKRLESIWDAALDCKRAGNFDNAETFWEIFKYCVKLVNLAQGGEVIEILNTKEGERYDTDKHSISGNDSQTQGFVREIILAGYKNNISKKISRKSNVRIGW